MLGPMHSFADAVSRLWRRISPAARPASSRPRLLVPVLVSVLVAAGTATGVVLTTVGGKPVAAGRVAHGVPRISTSPAPAKITGPVVPMLGGSPDGIGRPVPVPVAHAPAAASTTSRLAKSAPVAPLRG